MFFGFTEEEKMVQKSVRDMLRKHCKTEITRKFMEDQIISNELKDILNKQGLYGILEPNKQGISGVIFAILIAEEAGRAVLPFPLIENLIGLYALKNCRNHDDLVMQVEEGQKLLTIAWQSEKTPTTATAVNTDEGYLLSGILPVVPFASSADKIIANVRFIGSGFTPKEEETVVVLDRNSPSIHLRKRTSIDETYPIYEVKLNNYPISTDSVIKGIGMGVGHELMKKMTQLGSILLTAEMIGSSERALYDTIEYLKERKQFGTVIAKFQALKHMAADLYVLIESSKSAVEYAAWALETGDPEEDIAVSIAKSYTSSAAKKVTGDTIQMQGGIGFTWENDLHLFFKRATRNAAMLGDAYSENEKIATKILDK